MNITPILFYDGDCALCSRSVKFVLGNEKSDAIRFCAMQSEKGKAVLAQMGFDTLQPGTVIFSDSGKTFTSYKAVARIATYLRFPFNILSFIRFVPAFIGNGVYYWIARNRRKYFGVNDRCMMVVPGAEKRFERG